MKTACSLLVFLLCVSRVCFANDLNGTFKIVKLDGSLSDWTSSDLMYPDSQIGNGAPANTVYTNIYVANDDDYLCVGLEINGTSGATVSNAWFRRLYIDSDTNAATGFDGGWMTGGYDRLIQYGQTNLYTVYEFTGSSQSDWSWDTVNSILYSTSEDGKVLEWKIPRSSLGIPAGNTDILLEFNVSGPGVSVETWANQTESSVGRYRFGPSTTHTGQYGTVVLDGSLTEWSSTNLVYVDSQIGDGAPDNTSYSNIYVINDKDYLYMGFALKGEGGADITNTCTRAVYIDADTDYSTGFNGGWMSGGYDTLIQYGSGGAVYSVYEFTGGTSQSSWSWNWLGFIDYSYSANGKYLELRVDRSNLGMSDNARRARLEFNVTGGDVTVQTWAHQNEASVATYIFGMPSTHDGKYKVITMDGILSEWDTDDRMYYDAQINDGSPDNSSCSNIYVVNDKDYLYVGIDTKGSGGSPITNTWSHNLYMDTDTNQATGYRGSPAWMTGGYDHLISYGGGGGTYSVYEYSGATQTNWSWTWLTTFNYAYTNDSMEWKIPRSALDMGSSRTALMEFQTTGGDVTGETWASYPETEVMTFVFAQTPGSVFCFR